MMAVRNEGWVLGLSLRAALLWCDAVIVFDHASTDDTPSIVHQVMGEVGSQRVAYTFEADPKWDEMAHRQWMLEAARKFGATHVAIIDADEIPTGNITYEMRAEVERMFPGHILEVPLYNLRHGIARYHAAGLWGNRIVSLAFADNPALSWSGDNFHARKPRGANLTSWCPAKWPPDSGGIMHLWGADERRLLAKHALYKVIERLRWPNRSVAEIDAMYSQCIVGYAFLGKHGEWLFRDEKWTYTPVPPEWWKLYEPWMKYLELGGEPWQEAEVRRIVAEHGADRFAGLNLFGIA